MLYQNNTLSGLNIKHSDVTHHKILLDDGFFQIVIERCR